MVTLSASQSVTATFETSSTPLLNVVVTGLRGGWGTVTSSPAGINCEKGMTCIASFPSGTVLTLNAEADSDSFFVGWSGVACSPEGDFSCTFVLSASQTVSARFNPCTVWDGEVPCGVQ
jgi:hypothetical protein